MRQFVCWLAVAVAGSGTGLAANAYGQQTQGIGTVATADADVTGAAAVTSGQAEIAGNGTVTAKDHAAELRLARGGAVRVCATSGLHVASGAAASGADAATNARPLMLALDRGAMEIHTEATTSDVVMTPDLRLSVKRSGPLDLRLRVTPNGDTCVENRLSKDATKTPELAVTSLFGDASYEVRPGQHVLFEHGDLREVVDNESSPCGCPADAVPIAAGGSLGPGTKLGGQQAATEHPFPAAVSEGLAAPPPVPQAAPGVAHAQVATTLSYSNSDASTGANAEPPMLGEGIPHANMPVEKPSVMRRIGRLFKRIF